MAMTTRQVADARWLSEQQQQAWIGMTAMMWLLPPRLDAQLQRDSGLTLFEYFVLSRLSMAPDRRLRMRELATIANGSPSRLSNVVNKLERQGWLRRTAVSSDRRGAVAELTEAGWQVVVEAAPEHVETVRRLVFDRLTADQIASLSDLGESLAEDLAGGPRAASSGPCVDDEECVPPDNRC
jgi:DNA-binding MarR family transcriptional regulator